jgi:signal transduction histidine kinase
VREATATLRELVVTSLQDVRRLAVELRPKALDDFGLVPALDRLAHTFMEQTELDVKLTDALGGRRLPRELETAFYRIVQEALTNIVKHAQARRVSILLTLMDGGAATVIEDDGRGFDPAGDHEGLGLLGIRERLQLLHGRLTIESSPTSGTMLRAEVPL